MSSLHYTGSDCPKRHGGLRYRSSRRCVQCNIEGARRWRTDNREKWLAISRSSLSRQREWKREHAIRGLLYAARKRAGRKGVPFVLTEQTIPLIPDACPACGVALERSEGKVSATSPSLDRIVPELGYVPENVAWLCYRCNAIKRDASLEDLKLLVRWLEAL